MTVLVVPEDFRRDQYVLRPLLSRLLASLGKPRAKVRVCQDPLLGGVGEALKAKRVAEVVAQWGGQVQVIVLCIDRDGDMGRRQRLDQLEGEFGARLLGIEAWEEIETWVLAGLKLPTEWSWADVRAEVQVKERYFDVLAKERGVDGGPGGGRSELAAEAARRIDAIRLKCPEDFDALAQRLQAIVQGDGAGSAE